MRYLIACCDGTWNTPEMESVTNVRRLYNALEEKTADGHDQLGYYQSGVGTERRLLSRLMGGGFAVGLSHHVLDAYHWLTTRYEPGDRIALFGFSRGAYTARSLAGMISAGGLIDTTGLDEATIWRQIEHVYRQQYRAGRNADPNWRTRLAFRFDPAVPAQIPIHFIGVWDTVGALGVPDYLGLLNLLDPSHLYDFHDVTLNPCIPHARHALALDERSRPFTPTLWSEPAPGQDVKQVWFPGSHQDVGGGHVETGLSDGALLWMIEEAREAANLGFVKTAVAQVQPDPLDVVHIDDWRGVFGFLTPLSDPVLEPWIEVFTQPRPRAVPRLDPDAPSPAVDRSAYERQQRPSITGGRYRPTRALAPGESATVEVFAPKAWNETGLYLEAGDYRFTAEGEWLDSTIPSGPAGTTGLRRFNPLIERGRLVGTLIGQGETLFHGLTRNKAANAFGSRREEDMPWMSLVGVVANDAVPVDSVFTNHERIDIGAGTQHHVTNGGYFYAYANDAWGFYVNNQGSTRLTVTRAGGTDSRTNQGRNHSDRARRSQQPVAAIRFDGQGR